LVAGDVHRKVPWFAHLCEVAHETAADVILQVGDFGYWEHRPSGLAFLDAAEQLLAGIDRACVWIDGNHENHPMLRKYQAGADGFVPVRDRLLYAPRGHRWTWDGVRFLALGGAYSIDRWLRTEGESWWPEEVISPADVERSILGGAVDVLVSHDSPDGLGPPPGVPAAPRPQAAALARVLAGSPDGLVRARQHRQLVRQVVDAVRPKVVLHGHHHHRHTSHLLLDDGWDVLVEGLGRDGQDTDGWMVFETASVA
jgi:hypothetical protein